MNIAIDFDGTLTADPVTMSAVVRRMIDGGHSVFLVTQRRATDENISLIEGVLADLDLNIPIFMTGLKAKKPFVKNIGVAIDIWIDDNPNSILEDA